MKILYIANELADQAATAAQVRVRALLPILQANAELRVIAFPPQGVPLPEASASGIDNVQFVPRRDMGGPALVRATFCSTPRAFRRFDTPNVRAVLAKSLAEHRPDIVHFDGFATLGLLDFVANASPSSALVAHIHDAQSARIKPFTRHGSLAARMQTTLEYFKALAFEKKKLDRADLVLVDSSEDRDYLRAITGCDHVHTLPIGFDPTVFAATGSTVALAQPAIVYSGSMGAKQSVDGALFLAHEVMPLVWKKHPNAHLYIVGGGPTEDVRTLDGAKVHVTGFVDDLAAYLRAATVYVCALRLGSGMRTRVIEALACGTTMVATPISVRGLDELDARAPWILADTADDFAAGIEKVLDNGAPQLAKEASDFAFSSFAWDTIAKRLIDLYHEKCMPGRNHG